MGQHITHNFKKAVELHNFSEIFYCGMTWLRNTNLKVFIQRQYTRTILRKKNMRHMSLFKKHSKFVIVNKVFYCDMAKRDHK